MVQIVCKVHVKTSVYLYELNTLIRARPQSRAWCFIEKDLICTIQFGISNEHTMASLDTLTATVPELFENIGCIYTIWMHCTISKGQFGKSDE